MRDLLNKHFPDALVADPEKLMEQAPETMSRYLGQAVEVIERQFGTGYARDHHILVAALLQTAADESRTAAYIHNLQVISASMIEILDGFFDLAYDNSKKKSADNG